MTRASKSYRSTTPKETRETKVKKKYNPHPRFSGGLPTNLPAAPQKPSPAWLLSLRAYYFDVQALLIVTNKSHLFFYAFCRPKGQRDWRTTVLPKLRPRR
jgi:hypothetical protein